MFNKYFVSVATNGDVTVLNPAPLRLPVVKEDAINLIAWIKVLANISDKELKEAERQVENA